MTGVLQRLAGSTDPRLRVLLDTAGQVRDRLDHPQLRDARRLVGARAVDVVLLGESVSAFVSPQDADRRTLPVMVADLLGPQVRALSVHGGGYHAELLTEYVRLLDPPPPVLVVSLWTRGRLTPWIEHPRFSHRGAIRRLRSLTGTPRGSLKPATAQQFAAYYALPHTSLAEARTIGEHVLPLKRRELPADEALRLLYAFHHGSPVTGLDAVVALGRACRSTGSRVVAYQAPISVVTGERVLGPAFRTLVEDNLAAMAAAFRQGAGERAVVLETGTAFGEHEFVDPADGSEHLNESGRQRLAALLAEEVRRLL